MSDEKKPFSLIHIDAGDLSKPINTLIKKIANAIGIVFEPKHIKDVAEAEAVADRIRTTAQIEKVERLQRATFRFLAEQIKQQENIESIITKAVPEVSEQARPEQLEDDWIANFFDKCRLISDDEMQKLWARILAGETNSPGKFSKRTVGLLASTDKSDASMFNTICRFACTIPPLTPIIYSYTQEIYSRQGIDFAFLTHLESIGVIRINVDSTFHFAVDDLEQNTLVDYFGSKIPLRFAGNDKMRKRNELAIGQVMFTQAGEQLAGICGAKPLDGFFEFLKGSWASYAIPKPEVFGPPQF